MKIKEGYPVSCIGSDMYSDATLKSMKKEELIELLHIAQVNYEVLLEAFSNVTNLARNLACTISPSLLADNELWENIYKLK